MFGVGLPEMSLLVGTILVLILVWQRWRGRWVPVSAQWHPALSADEVERVLRDSFAVVPRAQSQAHGGGWSVHTVRRIPFWAVVFVVLVVFTVPLPLLLFFSLLLLFFARETADLHVQVDEGPHGCRVRAVVRTPERTLKALDAWLTRTGQREQV